MPLPDIQLDDRRFEELFAEAKRRIPVYTPEWTDHNESDPGITLLQLFSWLEEMILWRLNRVTQKNFIKFLELIGIELNPPSPARAELTFKLASKDLTHSVLIPQGTRVTLADAGEGPPVIFETDDNLFAVGAELIGIQSFDGSTFRLFSETNRMQGESFHALSETPQRDAALYLGFNRAFPPATEMRMIIHIASPDSPKVVQSGAAESFGDFAPPVIATWQYWAGKDRAWQPLDVEREETRGLTRSGTVVFKAPADPVSQKIGLLKRPDDPALFWIRYHVDEVLGSGYETPPRIEDVVINTITATNAITETNELLGASDGLPNQAFRIANTPLLPSEPSIAGIIEVDEGEGWRLWTEVRDFSSSGREDAHYTLNRSTGVVTFGDGKSGKIPRWIPRGSTRPVADTQNIRVARYRWGGGARGNAGAGKITSLQSSVPYVQSVTNLRAAAGGDDEETVKAAEERAPMTLRTATRAITTGDFEFLARNTPGARIRRARAFPLHNPKFTLRRPVAAGLPATEVPMPGTVTVVVVPESDDTRPQPSEETLRLVAQYLDQHRLVASELFVTGPRYRKVSVRAKVIASPASSSGEVQRALETRLLDFFHPLHGGPDGQGWEFGGTIYFSETYRQILTTAGVLRIDSGEVTTYLDDKEQPSGKDIDLEPDQLAYSIRHEITVSYE
jgi:predicted phage baseplate assembly protein